MKCAASAARRSHGIDSPTTSGPIAAPTSCSEHRARPGDDVLGSLVIDTLVPKLALALLRLLGFL